MRPYPGISPQTEEDAVRRQKWTKLDWFLRDLEKGMQRIQKGQVPDGSGTPILDPSLSDIYLVLKGRIGNQDAHGGTAAGGTLTLSSTNHPTKGKVFLGDAQQSAYDEVNERIGIGQPVPLAKAHIKTGAVTYGYWRPTSSGTSAGSTCWGVQPGGSSGVNGDAIWQAIDDVTTDDTDYFRFTGNGSGGLFTITMSHVGVTDPGVNTGFVFNIRLRATAEAHQFLGFNVKQGATTISSATIRYGAPGYGDGGVLNNVTTGFVTYPYTLPDAACALIDFTQDITISVEVNITPNDASTFDCSFINLQLPPVGGILGDPLQEWENPTTSNTLAFANDTAGATTLQLSGTPKFRITNGLEVATGSPASGMVGVAYDTDGSFAWASASSLSTIYEHIFHANGPYTRAGDEVDGVWIPKKAMTLAYVRLYRRVGGTSGSTQVTLTKNGTTMLSADPTIAFNAGASATADGTISVTAIAAGDRIAASAVAKDAGLPRDAAFSLIVGAY